MKLKSPKSLRANILEIAQRRGAFKIADVLAARPDRESRQYVSRTLSALVTEGVLLREGTKRGATYARPDKLEFLGSRIRRTFANQDLEEHRVLSELESAAPFLRNLPENIKSIFDYAFLEMLNNAIEHSRSKTITVTVATTEHRLIFTVTDRGIGVFRNVMKTRKLPSEIAAMQDLMKGKTTTRPRAHSGEGIFFTSKVGELFLLDSYGYRLTVDNTIPDIFFERHDHQQKGTTVTFSLSTASRRHLNDVFKHYQSSPESLAFDQTEIQVRLYQMGTVHISRSQARRVLSGLDRFKVVVLDFDRVPVIGQAFADEVFRVFRRRHPDIRLKPVKMTEAVRFMVERTKRTQR